MESDKCGENLTWTLDGDTFIISGTGAMNDYSRDYKPSWYDKRESIKKLLLITASRELAQLLFNISRAWKG